MEQNWTFEYFYQKFKDVKFKVGEDDDGYKLRIPFKYFLEYLVYNKDDSPIYLFEGSLETSEYYKPIIENYKIPPYFKDDLLKYAGEKQRPPYRWWFVRLIKDTDGSITIWDNHSYWPSGNFCMEYFLGWPQKVGAISESHPQIHREGKSI